MSGQTIRDVVIRIALEMGSSNVRTPDLRGVETTAKETGKKAGEAAGKAYVEQYSKEVEKLKTASSYWTDPTPGRKEMFGPFKPVSADETRDRLNQLQRERVILGENELVLKRNSGVLAENTKLRESNVGAIKSQIDNTLQLVRGIGLLGAALGEDTSKWLKYAAAAQGAMDVIGSASSLVGKLPLPAKLAVGAGAVLSAPIWMERMNERRLQSERAEAERNGLPSSRQSITDYGLFQNSMAYSIGQRHGAAVAGGRLPENEVYYRERGLGEYVGSGIYGVHEGVFGDSGATQITKQQLAANVEVANSRLREAQVTDSTIRGFRNEYGGSNLYMAARDSLGLMSGSRRLAMFDEYAGEYRASSDKAMEQKGVAGGTRDLQLAGDRATFELDAAKERLSIMQRVGQELEHEKQQLLENVKIAQSALDVERDRLKTTQSRLGMANAGDFGQLEKLGKKLARGEDLNEGEARLAQQYGVGGAAVEKFARGRFESNLSEEARAGLAPTQGVDMAERNLREAQRNVDDALPEIQDELQQINQESEAIVNTLKDLFKAEQEFREKMKEALDKIKADQQKAGKEAQEKGIKAGGAT